MVAHNPTPASPPAVPTSVYQYFDENDVLIYVGITARSTSRQREHNADKMWWPFVARQTVEHYHARGEALLREGELIRAYRPPFNTQQNPGYLQTRAAYLLMREFIETEQRFTVSGAYQTHQLTMHSQEPDGSKTVLRTIGPVVTTGCKVKLQPQMKVTSDTRKWGAVTRVWVEGPFLMLSLIQNMPPILDGTVRLRREKNVILVDRVYIRPAYHVAPRRAEKRRARQQRAREAS